MYLHSLSGLGEELTVFDAGEQIQLAPAYDYSLPEFSYPVPNYDYSTLDQQMLNTTAGWAPVLPVSPTVPTPSLPTVSPTGTNLFSQILNSVTGVINRVVGNKSGVLTVTTPAGVTTYQGITGQAIPVGTTTAIQSSSGFGSAISGSTMLLLVGAVAVVILIGARGKGGH